MFIYSSFLSFFPSAFSSLITLAHYFIALFIASLHRFPFVVYHLLAFPPSSALHLLFTRSWVSTPEALLLLSGNPGSRSGRQRSGGAIHWCYVLTHTERTFREICQRLFAAAGTTLDAADCL